MALLTSVALASGCTAPFFSCAANSDCKTMSGGRCESTGFCSEPDVTCASGYRYEKYSTSQLSGQCVVVASDLGQVDQRAGGAAADGALVSDNDPNNCGGAHAVCSNGQYCIGGACSCPRAIPDFCASDMGEQCVNEQTDFENCGACGNACPSGQLCQSGACVETCATSPVVYAACTTYCANLVSDVNNCGGCGVACALAANATRVVCTNRACVQACNAGYFSCDSGCCPRNNLALVAGQLGGSGVVDASGNLARFASPQGLSIDGAGNIYIADGIGYGVNMIRKMTPSGSVTTLAGPIVHWGTPYGNADGTGSAAYFQGPSATAVDASGNVYVADSGNAEIRAITPEGVVSTLVYDPSQGATVIGYQLGVAVDRNGQVYIADAANNVIDTVSPTGVVSAFAGSSGNVGAADGTGSAASFNAPLGIAVDGSANIYVVDVGNNNVRKISAGASVTTIAGNAGATGSADGTGTAALFRTPQAVTIDRTGNLYIADQGNNVIRKITVAGVVTTFAGSAGNTGTNDALGTNARFTSPSGVVADASGNVFVSDSGNSLIRRITPSGAATTIAGAAANRGYRDGAGSAALFNTQAGLAVDGSGNIYVADPSNQVIRKIAIDGTVSTLAGMAGVCGAVNAMGTAAQFCSPQAVSVDASGNIYVADQDNHEIRSIDASGTVTTIAGSATSAGTVDGTGTAAQFYFPDTIATDRSGNLYVGDNLNGALRTITTSGVVSTSPAQFVSITGVAVDGAGDIFVADGDSSAIYEIAAGQMVSTLLAGGAFGPTDGTGASAGFGYPLGLAVDASGNVFVADPTLGIRKITPGGVVTTVVGSFAYRGVVLGALPGGLSNPVGVAVFGDTLLISDSGENAILRATYVGGF